MSNNGIVIAQFTVLLALSAWVALVEPERRPAAYPVAVACTLIAMWTYWHAYFLPLFFALAEARWMPDANRNYRRIALWLALPAISFALHLLLYFAAYPAGPTELLSTAINRSGLGPAHGSRSGRLETWWLSSPPSGRSASLFSGSRFWDHA